MAEGTIIGKLLKGGEERDAIHVAVAPVIAAERLYPGQHIGFCKGSSDTETVWQQGGENAIGIVDPFLTHCVEKGDRFWMFLYQHSITSLKHNWAHPAFDPIQEQLQKASSNKEASEAWLREFASSHDCPDYDTLIAAASGNHEKNYGEGGYRHSRIDNFGGSDFYLHFGGDDAHGEIPEEFWYHVEVVTGKKITERAKYFSCSC